MSVLVDMRPAGVTAAGPTGDGAPPAWRSRRFLLLGCLALVTAAVASIAFADPDGHSAPADVFGAVARDAVRLRWQVVAVVAALGLAHYVAAAVAARAASGLRLPLRETVLVQLAAAAANRLTPAGLGAAAVNARFFTRRGLPTPAAVGSVAVLNLLGALADVLVFAAMVGGGLLIGSGGGAHELSTLWTKLTQVGTVVSSPWLWLAVGSTALVLAARAARRSHSPRATLHGTAVRLVRPVVDLAGHPRRVGVLVAASGTTTLILGVAFVLSVIMVPGAQPHLGVAALLVAFMAGSAAGNAIPVPAGLGSTEAALIAVLVTAQVPVARSVEIVLVFRVITFWLPAVAGLGAARHLRRAGAL